MAWVQLVALLALVECFFFAYAVGKAREKYGVKAPAITGNEIFERYFRVQQNTIEQIVLFLPSLFIAAAVLSGSCGENCSTDTYLGPGFLILILVGAIAIAAGVVRYAAGR